MPYRERLRVPTVWWLLAATGVVAIFLAYDAALGLGVALAAACLLAVACGVWLTRAGSVAITADGDGLRAGRAWLPAWAIGQVEPLDRQETAMARGAQADPHAFFVLAGYVPTSVRVAVNDPADPVPYWLVSTRNPQGLAAALASARDAGHGRGSSPSR